MNIEYHETSPYFSSVSNVYTISPIYLKFLMYKVKEHMMKPLIEVTFEKSAFLVTELLHD